MVPLAFFGQAYGCDTYGGGNYGQCAQATSNATGSQPTGTNSATTNTSANNGQGTSSSASQPATNANTNTGTPSSPTQATAAIQSTPNAGFEWMIALAGLVVFAVCLIAIVGVVRKVRRRDSVQ